MEPASTNSPEVLPIFIIKIFRSGAVLAKKNHAVIAATKSVEATRKTFIGLENFFILDSIDLLCRKINIVHIILHLVLLFFFTHIIREI